MPATVVTPLHTMRRNQAAFPNMASADFMRQHADGFIEGARRAIECFAAGPDSTPAPMAHLPGHSASFFLDERDPGGTRGVIAVHEDATGEVVGGIGQGTTWVRPDRRGRGIGTELIVLSYEIGLKRIGTPALFSPAGYATHSAAHRRAVSRALDRGETVAPAILADYEGVATPPPPRSAEDEPTEADRSRAGSGWSDAMLVQLRAAAGRHPDPDSFADQWAVSPWRGWQVVDSVGVVVDRCDDEMAALYREHREFCLVELTPGPREAFLQGIRSAELPRLREMWRGWDEADERGFDGLERLRHAPGVSGVRLAALTALAKGIGAEFFRENGDHGGWNGSHEMLCPAGRLRIRFEALRNPEPTLRVHLLEAGAGSAPKLLSAAERTLDRFSLRKGLRLELPEQDVPELAEASAPGR